MQNSYKVSPPTQPEDRSDSPQISHLTSTTSLGPYDDPLMSASGPFLEMHEYQQSPNQSTIPSLASPSNGDSDSPIVTAQAPRYKSPSQAYLTVVPQTQAVIAPPRQASLAMCEADPQIFDNMMKGWESIGIGGMDNFSQMYNQPGGTSFDFGVETQRYIQAVNGASE
jgi:hypothetical protein